jgi:hypothetical protein
VEGLKKTIEEPQSGWAVSRPEVELGISIIQVQTFYLFG